MITIKVETLPAHVVFAIIHHLEDKEELTMDEIATLDDLKALQLMACEEIVKGANLS